ncbi:hypothetical protein LTS10_004061 [Elasticomyces elasticus]|nr:hypothetical protein LTS10_004061 [Elasticomyces elasticus]
MWSSMLSVVVVLLSIRDGSSVLEGPRSLTGEHARLDAARLSRNNNARRGPQDRNQRSPQKALAQRTFPSRNPPSGPRRDSRTQRPQGKQRLEARRPLEYNIPSAPPGPLQQSEPHPPPTPPAPSHAPGLGICNRAWIAACVRRLAQVDPPFLDEGQLAEVVEDLAAKDLAQYLDNPITLENSEQISRRVVKNTFKARKMATKHLGQFLVQVNGFVQARNGEDLTQWLALEPPFNAQYLEMIQELQTAFPRGNEEALEQRCSQILKAAVVGDEGSPWTAFVKFMAHYLAYMRDVSSDVDKYLETYASLSELQQRANSALGHSTLGHLILGTVVANAKVVCRLAIGLDKQPELIAHLRRTGGAGDEGGAQETLPERAANILRQAFVTCLNDRVSGLSAAGKPEGKKRGIYIIANLCLKILFQCHKTRNATQIFENLYNLSPPLAAYPKRERVTYLFYLGRFLFQNSHFYRAQLTLQYAYDEAPARPECVRQRRHILVYLIASNIILGRFPSQELLGRPEAQGLAEKFVPICVAIKQGNLVTFKQHLNLDGEHAEWFLHFRILLQLRNRCEVLVWRSLARKVFILAGYRPSVPAVLPPGQKPPAATLGIEHLVTAFARLEQAAATAEDEHYTDSDFVDVDYNDGEEAPQLSDADIESKLAALIDQGLCVGYMSRKHNKLAIKGRSANAVTAGFPQVWSVLKAKAERGDGTMGDVPGWKKKERAGGVKPGPGVVLNFSNLRPVGAIG